MLILLGASGNVYFCVLTWMPIVWERARARARESMRAGCVRDVWAGEAGGAFCAVLVCIILAGFERIGPGLRWVELGEVGRWRGG